ncbi:MAG: hypothetical protein IJX01_04360 [Oscillospiraceae bacterium]|nr:hypothetical protein [Oscillospiraceae bacterium]
MPGSEIDKKAAAKERFLKKYDNIKLRKDLDLVEKRIPDFWENVEEIRKHYEKSISSYKSTLSDIIDSISHADMDKPVIHSIRYRIKDADSLIVKIIQKSAKVPESPQGNAEIEKYRNLTKDNYYKIITDLIGIRILIRYRYQWKSVHSLVWKLFKSEEHEYIEDWITEYQNDRAVKYIVEQPKAYVKQISDRAVYEEIGKNIFDIRDSDNHYASLHYIINVGGCYCELQVRTIFDEAWCECNHDFVYKAHIKSQQAKNTLERLSVILSQHTTAAESIVALMCDLATSPPSRKKSTPIETVSTSDVKNQEKVFTSIQKRATHLSQSDMPDNYLM